LAAGDFDGDGYRDLAIGAPGETFTLKQASGAVHVLFGSRAGLTSAGDRRITRASPGIGGHAKSWGFGSALTAGDFGHDQRADLAIAAPGEAYRSGDERVDGAGTVQVVYGSRSGLSGVGDQIWSQESPGIAGRAEDYDLFGVTLTSANFGHGPREDLVVGVPLEGLSVDDSPQRYAGAVHVIHGARGGLRAKGSQIWTQDSPRIRESAESYDQFGDALTAANFGKGRQADLAVGVPNENGELGVLQVIYGSRAGLRASGDQVWSEDSPGILEVTDPDGSDRFGISVASGRLDADGPADLAVGICQGQATEEDLVRGAVHVIRGSSRGLHAGHDELWTQNSHRVPGVAEFGDDFACHQPWATPLAAGDFGNGNSKDLAVGVTGENPTDGSAISRHDAGAVNVIYGARIGLRGAGSQLWHQKIP
jgi:hypothetical protein